MLTGIVTLDGEDQIFLMDRSDQSREIVTKKPNSKGMVLLNIIHDDDPNKLKATIRINGITGVINNVDLAENNRTGSRAGTLTSPYNKSGSHLPATPRYPGIYPGASHIAPPPNSTFPASDYNNRRVIRRPPISAPLGSQGNYPPNQNNYPPNMPNNYQRPSSNPYPATTGYPNYQPSGPSGGPGYPTQ
jgi:hypothetical protein